ncbi:hypothetical protein [Clostridium sp.]|uniref:hypothetical protein n=1 Tax=Clostridium sp. TaxID=1506 RepID=UPI003F347E76
MKTVKILLTAMLLLSFVGCSNNSKTSEAESLIYPPVEGYVYNESSKKYINTNNDIWYVRENDQNVIPAEQYIDAGIIENTDDFIIENRSTDVWELTEIKEVIVESGNTFLSLSDEGLNTHYRMDKGWYYQQVKELNNIDNINIIQWREPFKIPIYVDSKL